MADQNPRDRVLLSFQPGDDGDPYFCQDQDNQPNGLDILAQWGLVERGTAAE